MDNFKIALQYLLPKHLLSRLTGKFAAARAGLFTQGAIRYFIKKYQVNMDEAAKSQPSDYGTFNDFFTRALKPGIRPLNSEENTLIHPVDGAVSQLGPIKSGRIIQAKGHDYSSQALLGGHQDDDSRFANGDFATIYLAPKDYHRIHMPIKGTLSKMIYIPGDLFSVNPLTAQNVPGLFARNERVVAIFETEIGPLAMVLVGATIVASIETVWAGNITPPAGKTLTSWNYPTQGSEAITLEKGDEMGRFKLGSTVILLFSDGAVESFATKVIPGATTRMGEVMAKYHGT